MMDGSIELSVKDHVATLTLNRPAKLNTITPEMAEELDRAAVAINRSRDVRVVLLTGAEGRAFCAGSDINSLDQYPSPWDFRNRMHDYTRSLRMLRPPVVCAISGYCLGGGLELALHSDIRVADQSAIFGAPEVTHGWIGGGGASQILPRLVGPGQAMRLLLSGDSIGAEEAYRIGLIEELVDVGSLMPRAIAVAEMIASRAPIAAQTVKAAVRAAQNMGVEIGLEYENELVTITNMTEDRHEGVVAFQEKRAPQFRGK